jgi:mRNA-degrading endonuclease YafQ of YafQ-DinJ toxin-antitoxin module
MKKHKKKDRRSAQTQLSYIHEMLECVGHEEEQERQNKQHRLTERFADQETLHSYQQYPEKAGRHRRFPQ